MAPDRGLSNDNSLTELDPVPVDTALLEDEDGEDISRSQHQNQFADVLAERANDDTNFTVRGVIVGSVIGVLICFSNTYFGLQTGWISGMVMPASLIGFAFFKSIGRWTTRRFTPVENVLVQTVAGAVGTMPLGVGCVGVLPALQFLLKPSENGPIELPLGKLIVWSLGICFFGVFVAAPLRKEMIIREKLRFPSGTATALMIGVLHGDKQPILKSAEDSGKRVRPTEDTVHNNRYEESATIDTLTLEQDHRDDWKAKIKLLLYAFSASAIYTLTSYFVPQLRDLPIFGTTLASQWAWTFNPSAAYVAQGIIMGPATTLYMLFGAILGWAILSPMAKNNGWAPGPVQDWETGSKGWIVWISLAIMLADAFVNLGWLGLRPVIRYGPQWMASLRDKIYRKDLGSVASPGALYTRLRDSGLSSGTDQAENDGARRRGPVKAVEDQDDISEADAPPEHQINNKVVSVGFLISVALCIVGVHVAFYEIMPFWATILAILFSLVLSLMGVRALGETDLNPVSGISKLTQLVFAAITPISPNAITINVVAGAISESAALQAGDLMQDLKAGHLVGASPAAQFWGQLIGSAVGAISAALVYKLYTSVYTIPSSLFPAPTAYVWILTARLVTGQGLPQGAWQWSLGSGVVWIIFTTMRIYGRNSRWAVFIPGGIAVATAMYNTPSFTLARTLGGLITAYWVKYKGKDEETVIVLASGFILGEGVVSIVNLVLASLNVPHL